jgi:hypothetical protein
MIYEIPSITPPLRAKLDELDGLRASLGRATANPTPWLGTLRRLTTASSVASSVSIEGYSVAPGEAAEIIDAGDAGDLGDENRQAVVCYARAMDHVGVMATDPVFRWLDRVILDLQFDACYFQRDRSPGHWRTGPISVTAAGGGVVYEGPPAESVVPLMGEVVQWLSGGDLDAHFAVRGAMAHLHTVSVHPFRDGNGRISRLVQSLVLALDGLLSPEFSSIEEYLAANTPEYYAVLERVQGGRYQPERDATEWVHFCIDAHLVQARRRLDQIAEASQRWRFLEALVESRDWPDRLVIALEQSLIGGTDRTTYMREADISLATASNDFRRLVDAGLISPAGRGKSVRYHASDALRHDLAAAVTSQR